jgi:hypothetical protein
VVPAPDPLLLGNLRQDLFLNQDVLEGLDWDRRNDRGGYCANVSEDLRDATCARNICGLYVLILDFLLQNALMFVFFYYYYTQ